jgi:hypothetical protein
MEPMTVEIAGEKWTAQVVGPSLVLTPQDSGIARWKISNPGGWLQIESPEEEIEGRRDGGTEGTGSPSPCPSIPPSPSRLVESATP